MNTPLHTPVRREALRAAVEAHRRLLEAEEQVRTAEEDWNFARAQFGSAAAEEYGRRLEAAKAGLKDKKSWWRVSPSCFGGGLCGGGRARRWRRPIWG